MKRQSRTPNRKNLKLRKVNLKICLLRLSDCSKAGKTTTKSNKSFSYFAHLIKQSWCRFRGVRIKESITLPCKALSLNLEVIFVYLTHLSSWLIDIPDDDSLTILIMWRKKISQINVESCTSFLLMFFHNLLPSLNLSSISK